MKHDILLKDILNKLSQLGVDINKLVIEDEDYDMLLYQEFAISSSSYLRNTRNSFQSKATGPNWSSSSLFFI